MRENLNTHFLLRLCMIWLYLARNFVVGDKIYNRIDFPKDFIFGAGTSSYQVEGATYEDGRKSSIFDTYAYSAGVSNGDVAAGGYYKYKEDVQLMAETGLDAYRFSISWSRLIPDGRGPVNPKGLEYYNNLINELVKHGIQPHVTLLHLDLPVALETKYKGFLNQSIIEDFTAYADVCFREFGDRVKHWTTVNEANIFTMGGYDAGNSPPGRCSYPFGAICTEGDSTTEPYIAAHNVLLAHASAFNLYKNKYKGKQHGFVGFNLYAFDFIPYRNTTEDEKAVQRSYDFFIGWYMHPLVYGDYPETMKINAGSRIPTFTKNQSGMVKGSFDFIGLNYYTIILVVNSKLIDEPRNYYGDIASIWIYYNHSSPLEGSPFPVQPWGLQQVMEYFKKVYNNPPLYIQENGQVTSHATNVNDPSRVEFLQAFIGALLDPLKNGSNVKGYFVWSFMDLYELTAGYEKSFGLYYVNFSDLNLGRYPKLSQKWYSGFLKGADVSVNNEANQVDDFSNVLRLSSAVEDDFRPLAL
ncbi:hypothetical protein RND81_04G083300 [Saponaria officinalis]|uniref:Uncharacterized protein n=1 Tax=Saponaria officinalis TaxID=3572 RepID=A0AAW1LKU8_SAPOF